MALPFARLEEKEPTLLQKLLKRRPKQNAVVRINNLLAEARDIKNVGIEEVTSVANEFDLNLGTDFTGDLLAIYERYLDHSLKPLDVSTEDEERLRHLKGILRIQDEDAQDAHERVSGRLYRQIVQEVVADGLVTDLERDRLDKIRINLKLSDEVGNSIYADCAKGAYRSFFDAATSDGKLSPAEENELRRMAESLRLDVEYDARASELFEQFRLLWQIEEGDLPIVITNLNLQRGEVCHAHVAADFNEMRRVTRRVSYGGYSSSFKVCKGLYIRSGSYRVGRETHDVLTKIDSGDLYITNKRLIFMGGHKNITIRVADILAVDQYSDGIEVEKASGKSPFFEFSKNVVIFSKILRRVMDEA